MVLMLVENPGVPLAASSDVVVEPYPGGKTHFKIEVDAQR